MKHFRDILSLWNESGLIVTGLMCVGYFGSRGLLGNLPLFIAILGVVASAALAFIIANAQAPASDDGFSYEKPRFQTLDRFAGLFLLFLLGMVLFTFLGTIV